jgi:hypothetical protein
VRPWDGLTVDGVSVVEGGAVRVAVGPSTTETFDDHLHAYGPVDYPDGWDWATAMSSVADQRAKAENGSFGQHRERVYYRYRAGPQDDQAYCLFCRFHPWQESGAAAAGTVTVQRVSGAVDRWPAVPAPGGLVAVPPGPGDALRPGDRVHVAAGDVQDAWGNTNAAGSGPVEVRNRAGR